MRHGIGALVVVTVCGAVMGLAPAASGIDINTDGAVIGVVSNLEIVNIGLNPVSPPITVFANAGTDVSGPLVVHNDSTLKMTGGISRFAISGAETSIINFSGGTAEGNNGALSLRSLNSSVVNVSGGFIFGGGAWVADNGTMNIFAGTFSTAIMGTQSGVVNLHGGTFIGAPRILSGNDNAVFNIYGTNLLATVLGNPNSRQFTLSGFLEDGTSLTGRTVALGSGSNATLNLFNVPAPGSAGVLLGAAGMLALRRRRQGQGRRASRPASRPSRLISTEHTRGHGLNAFSLLWVCAAAIGLAPAARGVDFNTDGAVIGSVNDARVGNVPMSMPVTVFANAGTNVANEVTVYTNSRLSMSGGIVKKRVHSWNTSTVNISGGTTGEQVSSFSSLQSSELSILNISGGLATGVDAFDFSTVNITGGTFRGGIGAYSNSIVNLRGGTFTFEADFPLQGSNNSVFNIYGANLSALYVGINGSWNQYALSGSLEDGTSLGGKNIYLRTGSSASFNLYNVPGPGGAGVMMGGVGLLALRRRRGSSRSAVAQQG